MFSDSSSLFGKLNRLSSICLNDTIPRRHLGFKLLPGEFFLPFLKKKKNNNMLGKNKTDKTQVSSLAFRSFV